MKRVLVNQRDDVAQDVRWVAPFAEFGEILIYLPVYKKDDGKIVLRSWDPKSLSLSSLDKPRRKIKPSPGVFVIVRAAWSCPNIAPCLTRALKTWPIPAGPIVWTDHSVMHCSEKRENMRDDHCDCLWLIIKTQGHIGLAGSPASASFYPGEYDDSDGGTEHREGKNKDKAPHV